MKNRERIILKAKEFLESESQGIRHSVLVKRLNEQLPDIPLNTVRGTIWNIEAKHPEDVYKPARGLFRHTKFREDTDGDATPTKPPPTPKIKEEDFYGAFATWLVEDLEECTKAIGLGGRKFKDKWGTPDVIGVRKARESDIIKQSTEIVAAEVKLDTNGLITAFGQACSYKLFAHKSYIVVPSSAPEEDIARLDGLCLIFGIGLILFDSTNFKNPGFTIRARASKHEPDTFYVNKNIKEIEDDLFS